MLIFKIIALLNIVSRDSFPNKYATIEVSTKAKVYQPCYHSGIVLQIDPSLAIWVFVRRFMKIVDLILYNK